MLTQPTYTKSRARLDAQLGRALAEYDAAAAVAITGNDEAEDRLAELRRRIDTLKQQRADLDAAWRGTQKQAAAVEVEDDRAARVAAYEDAERALQEAEQQAVALVKASRALAGQAARYNVACLALLGSPRSFLSTTERQRAASVFANDARGVVDGGELEKLLESVMERFRGYRQGRDIDEEKLPLLTRISRRAERARTRLRPMFGLDEEPARARRTPGDELLADAAAPPITDDELVEAALEDAG